MSRTRRQRWAWALCATLAACGSEADAPEQTGSTGGASTGSVEPATTAVPTTGPETSSSSSGDDPDTSGESSSGGEPVACETPVECAAAAEARTAAAMEAVRDDPAALEAFLTAMPLGGDLHHHLSGSVYAETYLAWAEADGDFCITDGSLALSTACGDGNDSPVPTGRRDLYLDVVRSWSMFEFVPTPQYTGADHFFAAFGKFGALSGTQHGRMLADVKRRAATENVLYIEPMLTANSTARSLGQDAWQDLGGGAMSAEDYPGLHAAILAHNNFPNARARLTDDAENSENIADAELGCGTASANLGCTVTTRYQAYISRSGSDSGIFAQMVAAFEAAIVDERIVGLNLVGPEDGNTAMANYDRLMAMLEYLTEYYADSSPLRLALHAGEITAESIPDGYALDETQHIRKAVEVAGARRIGHGVDVLHEGNSDQLLDLLESDGILVEICLASNDIILELKGEGHPVHDYLAHGVPVALATDDQGIARSSLGAEYYRAVVDQGLDYLTLKDMARASIQYSFLPGESFWTDRTLEQAVDACAPAPDDTPVTQPPSDACDSYLDANDRASVQRRLEQQFEAFEADY